MESGEQNPDFEMTVSVVGKLGTEFMLDVAPAGTEARLVTKGARTGGSVVTHGDVAVVTASSPGRGRSRVELALEHPPDLVVPRSRTASCSSRRGAGVPSG